MNESTDLRDSVALVTGGSSGIGLAICERLAAAGADIALTHHPSEGEPRLACDAVESKGVRCLAFAADVRDADAATEIFASVESELGGVDILVCNAGTTRDAVLWKTSISDWDEVISVNLTGAFNYLRQKASLSRRNPKPRSTVLISSINGIRGKFAQSAYSASKAGLIGLGRSAAKDLGRWGPRVNIVAPGMTLTEMTADLPEQVIETAAAEALDDRLTEPTDIAEAVLFLSAGTSRHITGVVLPVDGGQLL